MIYFHPENPHIVRQAQQIAEELGYQLGAPHLSWKYEWIKALFGWELAKPVQVHARRVRWTLAAAVDKALYHLESGNSELALD